MSTVGHSLVCRGCGVPLTPPEARFSRSRKCVACEQRSENRRELRFVLQDLLDLEDDEATEEALGALTDVWMDRRRAHQ